MAEVGPLVLKVFIKGCYDSLMSDVRVEAIHIHPVKSCRRIEVEQADVIATGAGIMGGTYITIKIQI